MRLGGLALFGVTHLGQLSFVGIMIPVGLFAFGAAMAMPALSMQGLDPFPGIAGSASALMGFMQMACGFLAVWSLRLLCLIRWWHLAWSCREWPWVRCSFICCLSGSGRWKMRLSVIPVSRPDKRPLP